MKKWCEHCKEEHDIELDDKLKDALEGIMGSLKNKKIYGNVVSTATLKEMEERIRDEFKVVKTWPSKKKWDKEFKRLYDLREGITELQKEQDKLIEKQSVIAKQIKFDIQTLWTEIKKEIGNKSNLRHNSKDSLIESIEPSDKTKSGAIKSNIEGIA